MTSKFVIGTAQFGLSYGITNSTGQVNSKEVQAILSYAKNNNIKTIDTAISYGDSELSLGTAGVEGWKIFTKLPIIPGNSKNIYSLINQLIESSLSNLRVSELEGLFLHNPLQLLSKDGKEIWDTVQSLKDEGKIKKIGFSIYNPQELDKLWGNFQADVVQAPYNILDRRIKTSGWLRKLYKNNVEIQVRSVFLQGLLLMNPIQRNNLFPKWKSTWDLMDLWLKNNNLSAIEASLGFVLSEKFLNSIIIGIESKSQLKEIIEISNKNLASKEYPESLSLIDLDLIEPFNWSFT